MLVIFAGWLVYSITTDQGLPTFFPLNDVKAEYRITKNCPNGQGWIEQPQVQGNAYCLEYRGDNVLWKEDRGSEFFSITIGKSDLNLESYLGKKIKNIKGRYTNSGKQYIQSNCIEINGAYVVVDIDSLEVVN